MITPNMHYRDLKESYLFAGIAQKVKKYQQEHPEKHIYRMGIGDVSLPLCDAVIVALHEGVADQANKETFHGYMPECGAQFLWNQDCWEKYQQPHICRKHHSTGRK